jgi:hypothetical protein
VDLSNHIPKLVPAQLGWKTQQRYARVLITDTRQHTFGLDAAQCGMLLALDRDRRNGRGGQDRLEPTEPFLLTLKLVCMAQRRADSDYASSGTAGGMKQEVLLSLVSGSSTTSTRIVSSILAGRETVYVPWVSGQ